MNYHRNICNAVKICYKVKDKLSNILAFWFHCFGTQNPWAVILVTWEAETRGPKSKADLVKVSLRPYLKNKLKAKGPRVWLKWYSTCMRP
jgi:hypothetical protein